MCMADFLRISDKAVEKALKFIAEQAKEENTPIEKYCLRIYVEGVCIKLRGLIGVVCRG